MSDREDDDWTHEVMFGNWAFKGWNISPLVLRDSVEYFGKEWSSGGLNALQQRLVYIFGPRDVDGLQGKLALVNEIVAAAIDFSEREAKQCWLERRVWSSAISESLVADDDLVEIFGQSVDLVGYHEEIHEAELFAAVGLWSIGEWRFFERNANAEHATWALRQLSVAALEAGWRHAYRLGWDQSKGALSARNKNAADIRHERNRENKSQGRALWQSRVWSVQADAERAIATECHITKEVAGRWIREFKRAAGD